MEACTGRYFTGNPLPKRAEMTGNTNLIASLRHDKSQISCRIIRDRERGEKKMEKEIIVLHMMQRDPAFVSGGLPSALSPPSDRGRDVPSFFSAGSGHGWDKPRERCLGFTDTVLRCTPPLSKWISENTQQEHQSLILKKKNMAGTFKKHSGFYVNSKKEASRKASGWNGASRGNIKGMKMSVRLLFFLRALHSVCMHARAWIYILQ